MGKLATQGLNHGPQAGTSPSATTCSRAALRCGPDRTPWPLPPACYTAAEKTLKTVDGVAAVSSDKKAKTLEVTGKGVDVNATLEALFKAGFQASMKK